MLGVLAALGAADASGRRLDKLTVDFKSPTFPGDALSLEQREHTQTSTKVRVRSGTAVTLDLRATCAPGPRALTEGPAAFPAAAARDAVPGPRHERFDFAPDLAALRHLQARFGAGADDGATAFLLACSHLVGMVAPGRQALFSRVVASFEPLAQVQLPLALEVSVSALDDRFGLVTLTVEARSGAALFATAELQAFWRRPPATLDISAFPASSAFAGKSALVVGGSRGLGACLAYGLYRRGADCTLTYASAPPTGLPEQIAHVSSDASDPDACARLRQWVVDHAGRIDLLVLNASPTFAALPLAPANAARLGPSILALLGPIAVPLATLLDLVPAGGQVALISSAFVEQPEADWPHYIAAKAAGEALVRTAAVSHPQHRFLLVRPPRLKTDLTNTPRGWDHALAPESAAHVILDALASAAGPGVEVLSWPR